jgi:hypothetical protein
MLMLIQSYAFADEEEEMILTKLKWEGGVCKVDFEFPV